MTMRRRGLLAVTALVVGARRAAAADPPRLVGSQPVAGGTVPRAPTQVFVRFDRPVDHIRSRLVVLRGGQPVQVLHPRLEATPNLLFAMLPALEPGAYELRWEVIAIEGSETVQGTLAFTVQP
ncbi:copper resistance CopC family protein [Falsiroseomonas oryzae]|uniref:copper resistance CopC family protein n=1 Tax=Falsiroseomonas oryzae TaxID=2766473 RepID=UPI0022EA889A|nr:copper resistance CopC family protein [Roseomonas sp. MO-31]